MARFPSPSRSARRAAALAALVLALAAVLAASYSTVQPPPAARAQAPAKDAQPPAPAPPEPAPATPASRLEAIAARGVLLCGVHDDVVPFGFTDERSGLIIGFEVDLCRALAHGLGVRLKLVPVSASTRIPMLLSGELDLIAATMTHHVVREDDVDFSITYFMDGQKLLTRRGSPVQGAADLAGRKVGTVADSWASGNIGEVQPDARLVEYPGYAEAFLALKRGEIQALTADSTVLLGLKNSDEDPGAWAIVGDYITDEPYALGLPENDSDLRDACNLLLQEMWLSGEYMKIYNRWFGPHTKYYLPTSWRMEIWPGAPGRQ